MKLKHLLLLANNRLLSPNVSIIVEEVEKRDKKSLKDHFTPTWKSSHYLVSPIIMETQVKFRSPQSNSAAPQQKRVAAFS